MLSGTASSFICEILVYYGSKPGIHFAQNLREFGVSRCSTPGDESVGPLKSCDFDANGEYGKNDTFSESSPNLSILDTIKKSKTYDS